MRPLSFIPRMLRLSTSDSTLTITWSISNADNCSLLLSSLWLITVANKIVLKLSEEKHSNVPLMKGLKVDVLSTLNLTTSNIPCSFSSMLVNTAWWYTFVQDNSSLLLYCKTALLNGATKSSRNRLKCVLR